MASSSTLSRKFKASCFYCDRHSNSTDFKQGWVLSDGSYAALCDTCGSAYENGSFCKIFHADAEGWRDCAACKKLVHCGCIMAVHTYIELDFGGVHCVDCDRKFGPSPPGDSTGIANTNVQRFDKPCGDPHANGENLPNTFGFEEMSSKSSAVFLFEKRMTTWDAKPKNGRLVVPKKHAEAYFPRIGERQGIPMILSDLKGNELRVHYRYWANNGSKMYCLDGLKDYFRANNCKAGDIVKFYRTEDKMIMVLESSPFILDPNKP